jgi:hypothetical protein
MGHATSKIMGVWGLGWTWRIYTNLMLLSEEIQGNTKQGPWLGVRGIRRYIP